MPLSRRDLMLGSTAIVTASLVASPGTAGPLDRLSQIVGSPSISLDFAAGSYSLNLGGDTSSISGTVAGLVASKLLSVDRNAAAYAESTTGAWTSFSSNVLRVTNRGALIERAATNYAQNTALTPATGKTLDAVVYDECADKDCGGCCSKNARQVPDNFLIDLEVNTARRFYGGSVKDTAVIEWAPVG